MHIGFQFIWQPKTATPYLKHVLQLKVEDLTKQEDKETNKFILTCRVMILHEKKEEAILCIQPWMKETIYKTQI